MLSWQASVLPSSSRCLLVGVCPQGREKDIVIFSTVRSRLDGKIGFVADERRINVGLTRARSSLIVVGNVRVLRRDPKWSNFMRLAAQRK